jgi:peptide/nickel transport system ATP-binding protein
VEDLEVVYTVRGVDRAVLRGVSFSIAPGEAYGLVGESGCGKSTTGLALMGLIKPTGGRVRFGGQEIQSFSRRALKDYRRRMQIVFQDPFSSLNPRMRVIDIIGEAPLAHGMIERSAKDAKVCELMHKVGLDPAYRYRYPHQFSGGQRQRVGVARALALNPSVIVCDEAVAALDVSIQAQVLNLFADLREEFALTYFFISHNLGVVSHISDRVAIMYLGRIVEIAPTEIIFKAANHPYTQALIKELPTLHAQRHQFDPIQGELPSPSDPPAGCPFHPRCPRVMPRCREDRPLLKEVGRNPAVAGAVQLAHLSACHLNDPA